MIPGGILIFLGKHWRTIAAAAVTVGLVSALLLTRSTLSHTKALYEAEKAAHALTVSGYRAAAEQARADDLANARVVEAKQKEITDAVSTDYQRQLADLRARYAGMLAKAGTNSSGGGTAHLPETGSATGGSDAAASQDRLPLADALIASEQALQLQALQEWVRQQAAISSAN